MKGLTWSNFILCGSRGAKCFYRKYYDEYYVT